MLVRLTKDILKADTVQQMHQTQLEGLQGLAESTFGIPCPDSTCDGKVSLMDIQRSFDQVKCEQVMDKLLNVYMCNQNDVRKCPNAGCEYAGVIIPKPCSSQLTCE